MQKPSIYARAKQLASSGRCRSFEEIEPILGSEYSSDALAILRSDVTVHTELTEECQRAATRKNGRAHTG